MSKSLTELIQQAPLPDEDPCVESYIKICCEHGTPYICYEHSESLMASAVKSPCGGGSSIHDAVIAMIAKGWDSKSIKDMVKFLRAE